MLIAIHPAKLLGLGGGENWDLVVGARSSKESRSGPHTGKVLTRFESNHTPSTLKPRYYPPRRCGAVVGYKIAIDQCYGASTRKFGSASFSNLH